MKKGNCLPDEAQGIVIVRNFSGHRSHYLSLLAALLSLSPISAEVSWPLFRRLIAAPRLVLATFDDDVFLYSVAAMLRGILGRRTVGLFLRPQICFGKHVKHRLKRLVFTVIRRIPGLTLVAITPFSIEPRYASVAHFGAYDPQYWDLHDGSALRTPKPTALSDVIVHLAGGRKVLILPGSLSLIKGFGFLADILRQHPEIRERMLIVAAGSTPTEACEAARVFVEAGGVHIDRRLEDAELESLYTVSNVIWACYAPDYDQASGIFGRALQLGVPVVVRRGAVIEKIASSLLFPVLALDYGDTSKGAAMLMEHIPSRLMGTESQRRMIGCWRKNFMTTLQQNV